MPFIAPAIVGAVGLAGTTAGAILGGVINVGIAGGLAYASSALGGKKAGAVQSGMQTEVEMGGGQPRAGVFGRVGVAGYLAYFNTWAAERNMVDRIYILDDGPCDGLDAVWLAGTRHTLTINAQSADHVGYQVQGVTGETGASYLTVTLHRGYIDQPANTQLVQTANPPERWTAADRLAGICYVHVRGFYSEQAFPGGLSGLVFEVRGRRLYDWRKDSTAGGSGAHRWNNPRTWEFSENPIVQLYNYQRGTFLNSELTVGMGVPAEDLILGAYTAAANACDELVAESDGSTAPRYRCGTYVSAAEEYGAVIQRFLDACGGALYESVGAYSPQAGVAQVVTYTFTDADLFAGSAVRFSAKRPRADLANGVFGSFSDPAQAFELVAYSARTSAAAEAADGERRRVQSDYPSVHHALQAQRLAQLRLGLSRLQATSSITLGFSAVVLEPGDWVRWNSARYGNRVWLVEGLTQHADQSVSLTLREIGSAAYAWSEADEGKVSAPGIAPAPPALISTVPMMAVSATSLIGDDGMKQPALRVTWAPVLDGTVDRVVISYRVKGSTGAALTAISTAPNSGELLISAGVQGNTVYQLQGTIATTPKRATTLTAWAEVKTGDLTAKPGAGSITAEMFSEAVRQTVIVRMDEEITAREALDERLTGITDELADAVDGLDGALDGVAGGMTVLQNAVDATAADLATAKTTLGEGIAAANTAIGNTATALSALSGSVDAEMERVGHVLADIRAASGNADRKTRQALSILESRLMAEVGDSRSLISQIQIVFADANAALASRLTTFEAAVGQVSGRITALEQVVASDRETTVTALSGLSARMGSAEGAIVSEETARAHADGALGTRIDGISAEVSGPTGVRAGLSALTQVVADNKTQAASVSSVTDLTARVGAAESGVSGLQFAVASLEETSASEIDGIKSRMGANETAITNEAATRATNDASLALRITGVESTANNARDGLASFISEARTATGNINDELDRVGLVLADVRAAAGNADRSTRQALAITNQRLLSEVGDSRALISAMELAYAAADLALAQRITSVEATFGTGLTAANARIAAEETARASADGSLANQISTVSAAAAAAQSKADTADGKATTATNNITTLTTQQTALANAQTAMGQRVENAEAAIVGVSAQVTVSTAVAAKPTGATAAWNVTVKGDAGTPVLAGLGVAVVNGKGSAWVDADTFYIRSGSSLTPVFAISDGTAYWNTNIIAPKSLTAGMINTPSLAALSANLGVVNLGSKIVLNGDEGWIGGKD